MWKSNLEIDGEGKGTSNAEGDLYSVMTDDI